MIRTDAISLSHMKDLEADLKSALRVQAFENAVADAGAPQEILVTGYEAAVS